MVLDTTSSCLTSSFVSVLALTSDLAPDELVVVVVVVLLWEPLPPALVNTGKKDEEEVVCCCAEWSAAEYANNEFWGERYGELADRRRWAWSCWKPG